MSPKVSVIVPVYNVAEYLGQCLDTILLQTLQDIEVICVDDGSTDDSLNILNTYAMFDDRLKVIHQENAGAAAARNRGLKEAKGEFISVLDSDDFFRPEMLEKMVAKAEEDGSDVVVCGYSVFNHRTQEECSEHPLSSEYVYRSPMAPKDFGDDLFMFCYLPAWNKLIRHSFLKKHHIHFDESVRYCDDNMFSLWVLGVAQKISCMSECFVHYRWDTQGQQSQNKPETVTSDHCRTQSLAYEKIKASQLDYDLLTVYTPRVKESLFYCIKNLENDKKRQALRSIRPNLHPDLYNALFVPNKVAISLIVCAYNAAEFLPECLDSCLNQTLKEIEIICVDDGSTDNTLEILNQYAKKDNRITVIHQENQRQSIARANAMKIATGQYIQFLDADDWIEPDTCECLWLYTQLYDLDMLSFAAIDFKNDTKIEFEDPYHCLQWLPEEFDPAFTWKQIREVLPQVAITAPLTIYRHQYLLDQDITWINKKVAYEDTPFFIESLLKGARMGALPTKFYHKRVHDAATTQNMKTNFPDYCWICLYTLKKIQQLMGNSTVFVQYLYTFIDKIYLNYGKLDKSVQKTMLPHLYKFCFSVLKRHRMPLPTEMMSLCQEYLETKSLKKKCEFALFNTLTKWRQSGYSINPFRLSIKPFFLSVFGKILLLKNSTYTPKIKKTQLPKTKQFILCFDLFDDPTTEAIDAYTFFCWLQKHDIPSKYVISLHHPLAEKLTSAKDIIFADKATFFTNCRSTIAQTKAIISSFGFDGKNRDLKKFPWLKYIFIQHGSLWLGEHALTYYPEKDFDYILSTIKPTVDFLKKHHVWKNKQILCGLPRWENLKRIPHKNKNIFIFFTWRQSIQTYPPSHKIYQERVLNFLNSPKLNTLLKENNITLNMALHHAILTNGGNLDVPENVHLIPTAEISKIIGTTDLLITDYSSIMFDFMFLDIPAIFYRFDNDVRYPDKRDRINAKSAKSHDKELYNVFYDEDAVIKKIEHYIQNGFVLEPEYKKINDSLFWEKENICEHLYKKIESL